LLKCCSSLSTMDEHSGLTEGTASRDPEAHVHYAYGTVDNSSRRSRSLASLPRPISRSRSQSRARSHLSRPSLASIPSPNTPGINTNHRLNRPISFISPIHSSSASYTPTLSRTFLLFLSQLLSTLFSTAFLILVVLWALLADFSSRVPKWLRPVKPARFPWDDPGRWKREKCTKDVGYYAREAGEGYEIAEEVVETEDGYLLRCVFGAFSKKILGESVLVCSWRSVDG
jgi:hypothetical protein